MTVPNALTAVRALLVIPVIGLIATGDASLALLVFVGAAATDALDGPLARRRGGATAFGAALDPLAGEQGVDAVFERAAQLGQPDPLAQQLPELA